jgi:hypothetical protein
MALGSEQEETFVYVPVVPANNDEHAERAQHSSPPSPEEGCRLIRDFLRIDRPDLRKEIFNFVDEILRRQDGR